MRRAAMLLMIAVLNQGPAVALAEEPDLQNLTWPEQKCVLYKRAWDAAFLSVDQSDISQAFKAQNDVFLSKGCTERTPVCPRSPAEFEMANMLTVMTMNEGMASTFVPFSCS
jgi:hypothetical protein